MRILLVYPQNPDTFWSFKHVLHFVSKRSTFPPLGLLTIAAMLPSDWQLKLVDLNVERLKDSDLRWADYVMISAMIIHKESVYEIVARCTAFKKPVIFLKNYRPSGPRLRLSGADFQAFLKSFWLLGIWDRGRHNYWRFFWSTLLRRPGQLRCAIELAVIGYHFRRVASRL